MAEAPSQVCMCAALLFGMCGQVLRMFYVAILAIVTASAYAAVLENGTATAEAPSQVRTVFARSPVRPSLFSRCKTRRRERLGACCPACSTATPPTNTKRAQMCTC